MATALPVRGDAGEARRDRGNGRARLLAWAPPLALAAAFVALHVVVGLPAEGPVVHGDEGAYLRIARYFAGEGQAPDVPYYPGYGLLLVPLQWALGPPRHVFLAAKGLNAALAGAAVLAAYALTRYLMPEERRGLRLGTAAVASAYPSFLLFTNHAFAENALVPLAMALALVAARGASREWRPVTAAGAGALGAYAFVVHPRGMAAAAALAVVLLTTWWPWRGQWRKVLALLGGVAVVVALGLVSVSLVRRGVDPSSGGYSIRKLAGLRATPTGLKDMAVGAAGQVLYLVAASGGLVLLAAAEVGRAARQWVRGERSPRAAAVLFAGLTALGVLALSAAFISPKPTTGERPDTVIYGRYNEGVLGPVLLVGAAALVTRRPELLGRGRGRGGGLHRLRVGAVPALAGVLLVCALVVQLWQRPRLLGVHVDNPFNVLALYPFLDNTGGVRPLVIAAAGFAAGVAVLAVARWRPGLATVGLVVAFVFVTWRMAAFFLPNEHYKPRAHRREVAEWIVAVRDLPGVSLRCVAFDLADRPVYFMQNYQFWIDRPEIRFFHSHIPERPCGPLVVTSREDFDAVFPGARLATREFETEVFVWVLPGPLQDVLAARGLLADAPSSHERDLADAVERQQQGGQVRGGRGPAAPGKAGEREESVPPS